MSTELKHSIPVSDVKTDTVNDLTIEIPSYDGRIDTDSTSAQEGDPCAAKGCDGDCGERFVCAGCNDSFGYDHRNSCANCCGDFLCDSCSNTEYDCWCARCLAEAQPLGPCMILLDDGKPCGKQGIVTCGGSHGCDIVICSEHQFKCVTCGVPICPNHPASMKTHTDTVDLCCMKCVNL